MFPQKMHTRVVRTFGFLLSFRCNAPISLHVSGRLLWTVRNLEVHQVRSEYQEMNVEVSYGTHYVSISPI